jgi:hypothetical protein
MNEQRNDDYSAEMHGLHGRSEEEGAENLAPGGASNLFGIGNETFRLRRMLETRFRDRPLIGSLNYATHRSDFTHVKPFAGLVAGLPLAMTRSLGILA